MNGLDRATEAVRELQLSPPRAPAHTRARIVAELRARDRRRQRRLFGFAAALLLLGAPAAFAAVRGDWPALLTAIARSVGLAGHEEQPREPRASQPAYAAQVQERAADADAAPSAQSGAPATAAPAAPAPAPRAPEPAPPLSQSRRTRAGSADTAPRRIRPDASSATKSPSPLYLAAHRSHFAERDYAAALLAWDRYLIAEPRGQFMPEARYNRALCLVRLKRHAEAREALAPFAAGGHGGYRQQEAQRLLEALARLEPSQAR